jgi:hypothetical protein
MTIVDPAQIGLARSPVAGVRACRSRRSLATAGGAPRGAAPPLIQRKGRARALPDIRPSAQ